MRQRPTSRYAGITEDNPYYVLDVSEPGQRYQTSYNALKKEFEVTERPYLKSQKS